MNKFLTLKDPSTGNDVLVNTEHVSIIAPDLIHENGVIVQIDEVDISFATPMKDVKSQLTDDAVERCASNLFHIWEILRARLH